MENMNKSSGFEETKTVYCGPDGLWSLAISHNDKMITVGEFYDGTVRLFSINENNDDDNNGDKLTFNLEKEEKLHSDGVLCLVFSDDDKYLLSCSDDRTIVLSDAHKVPLQKIKTFNGHTDWIYCVLFKSENEIVSCSSDNKIIVWDINTGNQIASVDTGDCCYSLALSPNKEIIVVGQAYGNIIAYGSPIVNKTLEKTSDLPKKHTSDVNSLCFTPNGNSLVSFSEDKTINIYKVTSSNNDNDNCLFNHLRTLTGHASDIYGGAISPDGEIIASASGDETIKLWDITTGDCVKTIESRTNAVVQVAFSHSGHFLASVGFDNTLQITINEHAWVSENEKLFLGLYLAKSAVFVPLDIRRDFLQFLNAVRFNSNYNNQ